MSCTPPQWKQAKLSRSADTGVRDGCGLREALVNPPDLRSVVVLFVQVALAMCYPNPKYRERTDRRYLITGYWLYTTLPNPLNCEQPRRLGTPRFLEPQINGPGDAWGLALVRVSTPPPVYSMFSKRPYESLLGRKLVVLR